MSMPIASTPLSDDRRATDQVWNWLMTAPFSVSKLPEPLIRELVAVSTRICSDQFRETHAELSRIPEFRHYQVSPSEQVMTRLTHQPSSASFPHRPDPAQENEPDHPTQTQHAERSQPEQEESAADSGNATPTAIKTLSDIWHAPDDLTQLMNGELDHLPLNEWRVQMRAMVRRMTAGRSRTSEVTQATEAAEVALEVQRFMRQEGPTTLGELGLKSGQMPIIQAMLQIRSDNIKGFVNRQVSVNFSPSAICDAFIALVMMAPGTSLEGHPLAGQRINLNEVVIQPEAPAQQDAVLMRRILQVRSLLNQHFTNSYNALQSLGKHQGRTAIHLKDAIEHIWYTRNHTGTSLPTAKEVDGVELIMQRWIREQAERTSPDLTPIVGRARPQQSPAEHRTPQEHRTPAPVRTAEAADTDSATHAPVSKQLAEQTSQPLSAAPTPTAPTPTAPTAVQTGSVNFSSILQRHLNAMRETGPQVAVTPVSSQAGLELIAQRLDSNQTRTRQDQTGKAGDPAALHQTDAEPARQIPEEIAPVIQPDPMLGFLVPGLFGTPDQVPPAKTVAATPTPRRERKANNPRRPTMITIRSGNHSGHTETQSAPAARPGEETSAPTVNFTPSLPEISAEERQAISDRREAAKAIIHEMETHFDVEALQVRLRAEQLIAEGSEGQRVFKLWRNGSLVPSEDELMLLRLAGDIIRDESLALQELAREAELNEDLFGTEAEEETDSAFDYDPSAPTTRRKREEYILRMLDEHGPLTYNKLCRRLGIRAGKMLEITRQIPSIVCQKGVIQRRER